MLGFHFKCDECKKELGNIVLLDSGAVTTRKGYPFPNGNKHFCGKICLLKYVKENWNED